MDVTSTKPAEPRRQRPGRTPRMPRVGEEAGEHPASRGQRALWFLHRLDPESGAYNIAVAVRLLSGDDPERLRRAFEALVERHPALRTTFTAPGGEPRQQVHERMDLDWRTEDASGWNEERLIGRLSEEAFRPFDLEAGPLLRLRLFSGAPGAIGDTAVLMVLHHAVSDLWSITVLMRELGVLYAGEGERLSPPAVRFSDFVRWQEEQLGGAEGERLWAYWRDRLAGSLPVLDLATDRPRPPVQTWRGLSCPLRLAPDETAALRVHARERGATLFVLLLAGLHALLHRLTGQEDILVGAPTAGRRARELAGVIGYFVNPVVVRADLSGDPAWSGLMEQISGTAPADLAHQGYPFPLLAERLAPARDPSRPPVFQAMLVHERAPARAADIARFALGEDGARLRLGDLEVESIALRERRVLVDVTLAVSEGGEEETDGLTVSMQVNSDLFEAATAERMLGQWRTLVLAGVAEPERRLSDLPLLSLEERSELLVERNRTASPWPDDLLLHEPFEAQAGRDPGAVALVWNHERISYGDLNRRANRIAHRLRRLGVGPESRVGIHLRRSPDLVAALLGVLKAGGAYVPLDPNHPAERLEHVSRDAGLTLVVKAEDLERLDEERDDNPGRLGGPENLAYVLYTSGSTGRPKGCAVEHRSPVAFVSWAREAFPPEDLAGVLAATSIGFDLSVFELFVPLSAGGRVILAEDVLALPSLPARDEVRLVNTVPSAMAELERVWGLPASVRTVNLAGEPLRRELADRLYDAGVERVFNLYGPTEDTTYSTFTLVPREDPRPPAIGRPLANRRVYLLDRRGNFGHPVPEGVPGEVFLGGAGLARGYLGRPDLTAERFVPDAWSGLPGARLYATGDLARWRRDGDLELLGRIDHQVKIRGFRIETGEVEAVLATHPDVLEAAVVVREGPEGDRRLVAYLASNVTPPPADLQRHLRRRLPDYMVPAAFVRLAELPKTPSGKIDRRALPMVETEISVQILTPPRNPAEAALAVLWSELLGRAEVGVHDSFFDLGGHSLLAARLVARVREEMGVDLPLAAVLASPTVAALAERLTSTTRSEAPPIVPVPRDEPLPLSYGQRQIWLDDRMRPGTALYNMPVAVELTGALDPAALEAALNGIVRRHEALRTVLTDEEGGGALSRAAGEGRGGGLLPLVDLGSLPQDVRTIEADRLMIEEARRPFDLSSGLFLRALLLRLDPLDTAGHRLVLTLHHIAADGGSFAVLARELAALYAGEALPAPVLQYGDYAAWQRRWLTPERLAPRLAAARERLADVPALGFPEARSIGGGVVSTLVPAADLAALRELARSENATLPMLLLAAFSAILAGETGARRFAVGVPLANRGRAELEGMVGYLVNPVAVRIDVPASGGFLDLLAVVRSAALAAWTEEDLPFELVVRELGAARGASSHPIFQVMHVHQGEPPAPQLPGLAAKRLPLHTGTAKLDLTLSTSETAAGLEMELEHALDAWTPAEAARLLSGLQAILADPGRALFRLPLSLDAERQILAVPSGEDSTPPRTHTEEAVAAIWAGLLGLPRIGVHADLFALGAHSLLATRVVSRLRESLGVELPLGRVIERRTVAQLAEAVEAARREAPALRSEIPLLARGGELPLSFGQERLWFLNRLEPGSPAYHMPGALHLRGRLDVAALRAALAGVVVRHEVLRTGFIESDGRPIVRVQDVGLEMPVVDLSALPGPLRTAEERRLARAEARAPFRLDEPPLLRARLLRLDRDEHLLLLTLHHIVCDGWSLSVLTREVAALYAGTLLPPLPIQFADWAAWQRASIGERLDGLLAGWRESLAGAPAAIELPTDRPRPEERRALAGVRPFSLPADLIARLAGVGRDRGATPFMVLFAGFQALLHRLSGQDDLVVGTPIAGRTRVETEDLVGLFVNVLPVRARLDPERPFGAALDGAREALLAAYARQELPFEKLVEALAPERALGRTPLFQVLFVLQNAPAPPVALPGLELEAVEAERPAAKFDLTLELRPDGQGIEGIAEYDPALWDGPTVVRLLDDYERLLTAAAEDPNRPLADLPLLSETERHQLLLEWNDARRDWGRDGERCLHELIAEQAARTPEAVAVEMDGGESWTYAGLLRWSRGLAGHLRRLGAGPETVVAISAERSPGLIAGLLAILQAGAAYLPLDPAHPRERRERMFQESGAILELPDRLLGTPGTLPGSPETLPETSGTVPAGPGTLPDDPETHPGEPGTHPGDPGIRPVDPGSLPAEPRTLPGNLAYVIYTSGSTGRPKGAMNVHRAIVNRLLWAREAHGIGPDDRILQKTPIGFDVSVWELFLPLLAGARLVLARPGGHQDPDYLADLIARRQVTVAHFVPSLLQAYLESPALSPARLRLIVASGEALPPQLAGRFGERLPGVALDNLYGPTEAAVDVTAWRWTGETGRPVPIGRPVANVRIHLFDSGMRPVPIGVAGELGIGGVQLARGYLGRPDLTAERFVPDPFGEPGDRLYRTGDLARYRSDGAVEFLGRLDQQVKIRGVRVELPEIEAALGGLPVVAEAAVALREVRPGDRRLVAWFVASHPVSVQELRDGLARMLPAAMIPSLFVELPELPHLPSGKLDRRALAAAAVPIQEGGDVQEPGTWMEELLAGIWKDVLGVASIGIEDDFFRLGGHSLLAVQAIAAVRRRLGVEVPLRRLFEAPTVAAFARVVAEAAPDRERTIPRLPAGAPAPLSFGQRRLWFLDRWEPGSAAYNLPVVLDLAGELDVPALARGLAEVARRHEILRTRYPADGEEPRQEVGEDLPDLPVIDLTGAPHAAGRILEDEARRPFDLQRGPVLRAVLLRLPGRHVLLLTLHHIAADGWSFGVLVREVGELYRAFTAGRPSPLVDLRVQYADFAAWQRGRLQGEALDRLLAFWKEQLADAPAALELPTDRPRPPVRRGRGGSVPFRLDPGTVSRLKDGPATLFMALLAGFGAVLHLWTGDRRIVVGAPVAGRGHPDTAELIGFFVNSLPLALDFAGDPTFTDLLARVRETALAAFAHDELPFERLVEELRPGREAARTPVFQVMLVLQNAPPLALPGLTVTPRPVASGTSKLDLLLSLTETGDGVAGELTYDSDLFDRTTAARLAGHLQTLLAAAVDGERRLADLPLLGEAERHQLTREWNDTAAEVPDGTLAGLFSWHATRTPERPAVILGDEALTYGELDRRSDLLAQSLLDRGIGPESRVGLLLGRTVHVAVALLGVWKAGAAWVPLDPAWPEERRRAVAADAGVAVVLDVEDLTPCPPLPSPAPAFGRPRRERGDVAGAVELDSWQSGSGAFPLSRRGVEGRWERGTGGEVSPDNLAYVLYTSGSTGAPKGTLIRRGAVLHLARALAASVYRGLDGPLRVSVNAPLTFDASVKQWVQLLAGHTLEIAPEDVRQDGAALLAWIEERGVEVLDLTPAHLRMLLDAGLAERRGLPLRRMLVGGEAIDPETWSTLAARPDLGAWNVYGPTECTVDATACAVAAASRPTLGRPLANVQARVLDERMEPAPIGVPGHLCLGGDGLARGYLGRPDLTAERFVPDPFGSGSRLYRTGDRARLLADGSVEFLGRLDRQLKHLGVRIEPGEIEAALAGHPAVRAAVVALRGSRLVAWIVADPVPVSELRSFLAARLPAALVPALFVPIEAVPLTPHGKVDPRALPEPEERETGDRPRTPVEEVVAAVWSEVLGCGPVGRHDSFFDLGGHSLAAARAAARLRTAFGVELPLRDLFEAPTVAALALRIESGLRHGRLPAAPPLRPVHRETAPLSFAQERLWFLDRLEPGSAAYNIPAAVRLEGALDPARLAAALAGILARHEALRSRFSEIDGRPVQIVEPARPVPLPVADLSALPRALREAEAERRIAAESRRPFDLERGPLLRALLLRLDAADHVAVLTQHHIASDGWSRTVLLRDLTAFYRREPLPALPVQYGDFAVWQRQWLTGEVREARLGWWREALAGLPRLDLPTDRPRPAAVDSRGAMVPVALSSGRPLSTLARREGASLFIAVLAGFEALLGRYTERDDVAVGVPLAGRDREEIEDLIGFFVNPVVLRLDLSGGPTFRELLARAREATLGAWAHQDLPFELLVEALAPRREPGQTPLFQVALAFQNTPRAAFELPGLTLSPLSAATGTSKFDLTLALEEDLAGALEYRTGLFDEPTVLRLAGHLDVLLAAAVADPGRRVDDLPLLSEPESAQVLREWNATATAYPSEASLYDLFLEQAAATPDAVALIQGSTTWTYAELRDRAETLALGLDGLPPETRVALLLDRGPDAVAATLAVLAVGAVYVPLDPGYPAERLAFLLDDSGASVVLTVERHRSALPDTSAEVLCTDGRGRPSPLAGEGTGVRVRPGGDALAYIMYTSGSTGVPKGAAIPHRGIVRLVRSADYATFGPDETFYQMGPLAFDAATLEIWGALLNGGRLVLAPPGVVSPDQIAAAIVTHRITILWLTAGLFHVMAEQPATRAALGHLRHLLVGGDVVSPLHVAWTLEAGARMSNGYGPTESTTFSSIYPLRLPLPDRPLPIGRPIANTRVYVLDRALRPLPVGIPGELYVGGDGLARGYLDRALAAERFVPDPFAEQPGGRLYRTGDLARLLPDGNLDFLGRKDNQVKIRGFRVEPGEVEAALLRLPEVAAAAVLAVADAAGEKSLAAFYTAADPSAPPTARQIRERLQESLPAHLVPSALFLRTVLPLNPNGKVDRAALARGAFPAPVEISKAAPRSPVEELVTGVWAEVLGVEKAGVHDDFFERGGHSLLAARAVSRLRESLGVEVPLRELFESPTPAGLAAFVERALQGGIETSAPPITPVRRDGPLVPSFAQERLWFLDRLAPGSAAYNVPWALRLRGRLDPAWLAAAIHTVAARHEPLRTVFGEAEGRPVLEITSLDLGLPVVDLSGLPDPKPEQRRLSAEEARRPFDLARGPLLRAALLRLEPEEHHLLLTLHHAVCDGGSIPILARETLAALRAAIEGRPADLPDLPVQYADYAAWQRSWLTGDVLDRELAWWRERLAGAPPLLDLPLDRPRPRVRRPRGAVCSMELPEDLARSLVGLGRRRGATLFMTFLAAFDLLLSRHSGQEDLCVGFPVAGRNRIELESLVGLFVNTLVARADLSGDPAFAALLARTRERVLEAWAHQEIPFERLVEELAPRRDLGLTPLFQALFVQQTQTGFGTAELPGLTVEPVGNLDGGTAKLDLTLAVAPRGEALAVTLDYDASLFDRATALRLLGHWRTLLAGIVETPDARLSDLPLLTASERAQVLEEWSGSEIVESGACLHRLIEEQADRTPDALAIVAGDRELTYADLDRAANRFARTLIDRGAGPEVPVAVCLERTADLVVALLAVLKSGAAYVPIDPRYPPARRALILEDSRAAILVTEVVLDGQDARRPEVRVDPGNLAYIIYTSGSTGRPKGVGIEHRSAAALVAWAREAFPAPALEAVAAVTSICFDLSVFEIFVPLATSGRVILVEDALAVPAGATLVNTVPSAMAELVRSGSVPPSAAVLNLAGEPLPRPLVDALHELEPPREVINLYGPTETTTYSTMARMVHGDERAPAIGRPIAGDRIYLVDRHLRPVPAGVAGEVLIGGAGVARGYVGRPDLTAERFVPDPFGDGARLYRTGDLARWRVDGELELVGRIDHQVKLRGFRIEPGEVEAVLLTHPAVEEAAVVVRDDRLVAYAAPESSVAELRAFLAERLPAYLLPSLVMPIPSLPRTANGKVDRAALPSPEGRPEAMPSVPPSGPTEEALARIWSDLLGVGSVGVNESFFDLGGHSLLGAQLLARVRSELRVDLPLQTLFEAPTIAALAAEVDRGQGAPVADDSIPRVTDEVDPTELLSRIDELSDAEVEALLRDMQG